MREKTVTLAMGAGGKLSQELYEEVFLSAYGNEILRQLDDAAEILVSGRRLAFTTDSYTVKPIFFPGGDIGKLSICGTVNDLSVKGARPLFISAGFIIEEGFLIDDLKQIARSMQENAKLLGVTIVTGDTKVVGKGEADGIFINTSGIGEILAEMQISSARARAGDSVIISGTVADHGIAVFNARQGLEFNPEIQSDVAGIFEIVERLSSFGSHIHAMRDPTRGGVASVVNEIAVASKVTIRINEKAVPIAKKVDACCQLVGFDPLYVACEGKIVLFVAKEAAQDVLSRIKEVPLGVNAAVIGTVEGKPFEKRVPPVYLETRLGGTRFLMPAEGELLPRIC